MNLKRRTRVKRASPHPAYALSAEPRLGDPKKLTEAPSRPVRPRPISRASALMPDAQTKTTRAYTRPGAAVEALWTSKPGCADVLLRAHTRPTPISSRIKREVVSWVVRGRKPQRVAKTGPRCHAENPRVPSLERPIPDTRDVTRGAPRPNKARNKNLAFKFVRCSCPRHIQPEWPL